MVSQLCEYTKTHWIGHFILISFLNFYFIFILLLFWCGGMWDLTPRPGIKPTSPAMGVQSPNHRTTREVPELYILKEWILWHGNYIFIKIYIYPAVNLFQLTVPQINSVLYNWALEYTLFLSFSVNCRGKSPWIGQNSLLSEKVSNPKSKFPLGSLHCKGHRTKFSGKYPRMSPGCWFHLWNVNLGAMT